MTDLEAIAQRGARRHYKGNLTKAQIQKLEALAAEANLECGLSIRIMEDGTAAFGGITSSYGLFSGVRTLAVMAGPQNDANLLEKIGRCGERLILEAVKMDLGTCWVAGTFDRKRLASQLGASQKLAAVITVGPVKETRGTLEKAVHRVVAGKGKAAAELYTADAQPPDWFLAGMEAVTRAPSAMNRQPVRFKYENGVVSASAPAAQEYELIDLGIAKLHFEIAANGTFPFGNGAIFAKDA